MNKSYNLDKTIDFISQIFQFGFDAEFSFEHIQDEFVHSLLCTQIENNDDSFIYDIEKYSSDLFDGQVNFKSSSGLRAYFLAEAYVKLFYKFQKSFEYLFIYLPLSFLYEKYDVYHEMDISMVYDLFASLEKEETLLNILIKKKKINKEQLSLLTGISLASIKFYTLKNDNLFNASNLNIYLLSRVFDVKDNLFVPSLGIYLDSSSYQFDKINKIYRDYFAFYLLCFYSKKIKEKDYTYDKKLNLFVNKNSKNKIFINLDYIINDNSTLLDIEKDTNNVYIFYDSDYFLRSYENIEKMRLPNLIIINREKIFIEKKWFFINEYVNRCLLIRAKNF